MLILNLWNKSMLYIKNSQTRQFNYVIYPSKILFFNFHCKF